MDVCTFYAKNLLFLNFNYDEKIIIFNLWLGFDAINECVYVTKKIIKWNNLFSNINKKIFKIKLPNGVSNAAKHIRRYLIFW